MSHILVLTAKPGSGALSETMIAQVRVALDGVRTIGSEPRLLAIGEALEDHITFEYEDHRSNVEARVQEEIDGLPIDLNIIQNGGGKRRKKLLIADMDSTIINQECIDEIADYAGVKAHVSQITERAMAGELNFEAALRERVGLLKDLGEDKLRQVFEERLTLMPGARTLVQTMRANGAFCALVSGGFTFFTSRIAAKVGFQVNQANKLKLADGKLTGSVGEPILGRQAKLDALRRYISERGIDVAETLAVGDGANDLDMIKAAGLGVAYRAKPIVAAEAQCSITHGDLTALLYLQGYRRDEFVTD